MRIEHVLFAPGTGAFFYDDQMAIRRGVESDGFVYRGAPVTPGFASIRMPAQSLGVGLVLSDGVVVWGDMMSVQYSGAGCRDPVFVAGAAQKLIQEALGPKLANLSLRSFREDCAIVLAALPNGDRLPRAVEYGLSQALLRATAHASRRTMTEVICREFGCPLIEKRVPLYAQSGDMREVNVDKMILKGVDILPHGLINSRAQFGAKGEKFREFARWVARRVEQLGGERPRPILHFDVYAWIGLELGLEVETIADFIASVAADVEPFQLHIECPVDFGSREAQIEGYAAITATLRRKECRAKIVVDERCNTLDDIRAFALARAGDMLQIKMPDVGSVEESILAVLECKRHGVGAYLGGSCVETDLSAIVSVHVAVATQADMMLAKPGMGVDEALTITGNEQSRLLATLANAR